VATSSDTFLVTGVLGCIGAWAARQLLADGAAVVGFDLGGSTHRLDVVLDGAAPERLVLVDGDVTDSDALGRALDAHGVTHVIHLAALQIPACRANPALGARVNVAGTANVFEAVKARRERICGVVYASSVAVYGPDDRGAEDEETRPRTLYGVYKRTTEHLARVYWDEDELPSAALRPYTVFGLGRDQGLTSEPTLAMAAAAHGESFRIGYGGRAQFDYAPDVARGFVELARSLERGAVVHNMPGPSVTMGDVVAAIERAAPESAGAIAFDDVQLPFPQTLESSYALALTPFEDAVAETVAGFRRTA
jgi:UDP-glucuronate 4-epimerase